MIYWTIDHVLTTLCTMCYRDVRHILMGYRQSINGMLSIFKCVIDHLLPGLRIFATRSGTINYRTVEHVLPVLGQCTVRTWAISYRPMHHLLLGSYKFHTMQ